MLTPLRAQFERWREYTVIADVGEIARRYFAMNAFDGVLTIIGVLMGSFVAGVTQTKIVVVTGLSTSVAMGISGLWGSYLTESAERRHEMGELEKHTLVDLRDTKIGRASRLAAVIVSLVDGLSPFMAAVLVLVPFFLAPLFAEVRWVYYVSFGIALALLFLLGVFLGRISRGNLVLSGLKTVVAGAVCMTVSYFVE